MLGKLNYYQLGSSYKWSENARKSILHTLCKSGVHFKTTLVIQISTMQSHTIQGLTVLYRG